MKRIQLNVSERQFHTLLAALRFWQRRDEPNWFLNLNWLEEIASNEGRVRPLTESEIDRLCEKFNFQEA